MLDDSMITIAAAALAAFAAAALVFAVVYPFISGDREMEARYRVALDSRANRSSAQTMGDLAANRRKAVADSLKELEDRQKAREKISLRLRLQQAGLNIS